MDLIKVEGIVINKRDINDSDRIVIIFTKTFGKISVLLKGIRKSKKRDKIGSDILSYTRMVVYKKENSYIGNSIECINSYENIRQDMNKISVALYIFHVLNQIFIEGQRNTVIFNLTKNSINYIEKEKNVMNYTILLVYYLYKIIIDEGLKFKLEEGRNFSINSSVISNEVLSDSIKLSDSEYEIIKTLYLNKVRELLRKEIELKDLYSVLKIYEKYLNYHLEMNLELKNYILEA